MTFGKNSAPSSQPACVADPTERRNNALAALKLLVDSPALAPHLKELLSARDAQGQTPFMLAVCCRAYQACLYILDAIQRLVARTPTPTTYEDIPLPPPSSTEEKFKRVLSDYFSNTKGDSADAVKKQNYPSWLYPAGTQTGRLYSSLFLSLFT